MKEKVVETISSFISDPSREDEQTKNVLATFANCRQPGISSDDDQNVTVHVNVILRQFHLLYEENEQIRQGIVAKQDKQEKILQKKISSWTNKINQSKEDIEMYECEEDEEGLEAEKNNLKKLEA